MTYPGLLLTILALSVDSSAPACAAAPATETAAASAPQSAARQEADSAATQAPAEAQPTFNILGREDAPVAIVEFSDLQCPYCAMYALQTFPRIKKAYIDTGKVRYAAVNFPLPMHAYALPAAIASRCAGEQGKFWQYRDAIYADQEQLASDPFDALAGRLHLDVKKFKACRRDLRQDAAIRGDLAMARQDGITSTPSFMIGRVVDGELQGETITGAQPFAEFAAKIDALLHGAR
jgi:protein-disulfide isomerase